MGGQNKQVSLLGFLFFLFFFLTLLCYVSMHFLIYDRGF